MFSSPGSGVSLLLAFHTFVLLSLRTLGNEVLGEPEHLKKVYEIKVQVDGRALSHKATSDTSFPVAKRKEVEPLSATGSQPTGHDFLTTETSDSGKGEEQIKVKEPTKTLERNILLRALMWVIESLGAPFKFVYERFKQTKTEWPWNRSAASKDELMAGGRISGTNIEREAIKNEAVAPDPYLLLGSGRELPLAEDSKARKLTGEILPDNSKDFSRVSSFLKDDSTMDRSPTKLDDAQGQTESLLGTTAFEAAKEITRDFDTLRNKKQLNSEDKNILRTLEEFSRTLGEAELIGHIALWASTLQSESFTISWGPRDIQKLVAMRSNGYEKVRLAVEDNTPNVSPLITAIFQPKKLPQVDFNQCLSGAKIIAPEAHDKLTRYHQRFIEMGQRPHDSLQAKANEMKFMRENIIDTVTNEKALNEGEQITFLVYLFLLEREFRSNPKYRHYFSPSISQPPQILNEPYFLPSNLKRSLKQTAKYLYSVMADTFKVVIPLCPSTLRIRNNDTLHKPIFSSTQICYHTIGASYH